MWHVGKRLHDEGVLKGPEEVLILRREDLEEFVVKGATSPIRFLVNECRREMQRLLRLEAPQTLGVAPPVVPAAGGETTKSPPGEAGQLTGKGIGGGEATGVARKVRDLADPRLLDALQPTDILVLPHEYAFHFADWHSILTLVTAIVSPGKLSHHLAQVARECGVPVIGHVTGDLDGIKDGARLHVDARAGVVRVLD